MKDKIGTENIYINHPEEFIFEAGKYFKSILKGKNRRSEVLFQLFSGKPLNKPVLNGIISTRLLNFLEKSNIIQETENYFYSPFKLCWLENYLIFTDLSVPDNLQGELYLDPLWDSPVLSGLTIRSTAETGIDVGTGCGAMAIILSGYCRRVFALDLNPRAIEMAKFNSVFNGIKNITTINSNLFEKIPGTKGDRIVFNSPTNTEKNDYVNLLRCGEGILEKFFKKLPFFLSANGFAQLNLAMNDYPGSSFNSRLKSWLGDSASKTDVLTLISYKNEYPDHIWKRGWMTLKQGTGKINEKFIPYYHLPAEVCLPEIMDFVTRD
jgi:hypothetical protein